jgi:bifunctional non-homologous end joining protein LigD
VLDFDPPDDASGGVSDASLAAVRDGARAARQLFEDLGLVPFLLATGSRGLHVVVPLQRRAGFDEVRAFADAVGRRLVEEDPKRLTMEWSKAKRGDRIYVDVGRNAYAQHGVAPYAVRARPEAPVATPIRWEELSDRSLLPTSWTLRTLPERLAGEGDAWAGIAKQARALPDPARLDT